MTVGMKIEMIRHYTANQVSSIPVSGILGVLGPTVGIINEMIRHYTVNQASNILVLVFWGIIVVGFSSSQFVPHEKQRPSTFQRN